VYTPALGGKQNCAGATKTAFLRFDMKLIPSLICFVCFSAGAVGVQSPVILTVNTQSPGAAIPSDFLGLSFEMANLEYNGGGVSGYMFDSTNTELVTLFTNLGIKSLRIGGTSTDKNTGIANFPQYTPTNQDIDALFRFANAADVHLEQLQPVFDLLRHRQ
jgi:hypothetical protein